MPDRILNPTVLLRLVPRDIYIYIYRVSPIFKRRNFTRLLRTSNKEKQCKFFLQIRKFFQQIFLQYFGIFLILMCALKYIDSHTIKRFYTLFYQ